MAIRERDTSRLRFARIVTIPTGNGDEVECYELPEYPEVSTADSDIIYTVSRRDRIDVISTRYYTTPDLWWVIALANDLRLLPNDLWATKTIRVPAPFRVFNTILKRATRRRVGR